MRINIIFIIVLLLFSCGNKLEYNKINAIKKILKERIANYSDKSNEIYDNLNKDLMRSEFKMKKWKILADSIKNYQNEICSLMEMYFCNNCIIDEQIIDKIRLFSKTCDAIDNSSVVNNIISLSSNKLNNDTIDYLLIINSIKELENKLLISIYDDYQEYMSSYDYNNVKALLLTDLNSHHHNTAKLTFSLWGIHNNCVSEIPIKIDTLFVIKSINNKVIDTSTTISPDNCYYDISLNKNSKYEFDGWFTIKGIQSGKRYGFKKVIKEW